MLKRCVLFMVYCVYASQWCFASECTFTEARKDNGIPHTVEDSIMIQEIKVQNAGQCALEVCILKTVFYQFDAFSLRRVYFRSVATTHKHIVGSNKECVIENVHCFRGNRNCTGDECCAKIQNFTYMLQVRRPNTMFSKFKEISGNELKSTYIVR